MENAKRLTLKDLVNRVYEGNICTSFDYFVVIGDGEQMDKTKVKVSFLKQGTRIWQVSMILNTHLYFIEMKTFDENMSILKIANLGLQKVKSRLIDEAYANGYFATLLQDVITQ